MRWLLDANILLRLAQKNDPNYHSIRRALLILRRQGIELCVFPQCLAEFWSVATRPITARGGYGLSEQEAYRRLQRILRRFVLLEEVAGTTLIWRRLLVRYHVSGVAVHDSRLVALMKVHQIEHILTLNVDDFLRYREVTATHPSQI
jgi:predicted nucleic acid-binding protein